MPTDKNIQEGRIGLIAGNGKYPMLFAQEAKKRKNYILAIAVKKDTDPALEKIVDKIYWLDIKDFTRMFTILTQEGINKAIMAGQINPMRLFSRDMSVSKELADFLNSVQDKRADTVFGAISQRLQDIGVQLIDSTTYLSEFLPKKGVLTRRNPEPGEWEDINFGINIAKILGQADIGQTVAIKNKIVVAVEAIEGTDATIKRAGRIVKSGSIIVKTSKPKQDMRFDVPLVGLRTIKKLVQIKAACLAIEADKVLLLDRAVCIKLADRHGIAIVAA